MSYIGSAAAPTPAGVYTKAESETKLDTKLNTTGGTLTGNLIVEAGEVSQAAQTNDIAVFKNNANGYIKLYGPNTSTGGIAFGDSDDPYVGALTYSHSSDAMTMYVNNSERMRIDSAGNVGIGTDSPGELLSLYKASGDPALRIQSSAGNCYVVNRAGTSAMDLLNSMNGPITFATNNAERMRIDSAGRVTMPYQPMFYADTGAQQSGAQFIVQFTNAIINVGGHYNTSNFKFTAPVAGRYRFDFNAMSNGGNTNRFGLFLNGVLYSGQRYAANQTYENFSGVWIVEMAVNDYVEIVSGILGEGTMHSNFRSFTGQLSS